MNRSLRYLNLAGVLALAVLCAAQWRANRFKNLEVSRLERSQLDERGKLEEQRRSLEGCTADLERFREQLTGLHSKLKEAETRLRNTEGDASRSSVERDQLKSSITNWVKAVSARDERLKELGVQLQKIADERNDAFQKFNEVAAKYNDVVSNLNVRTKEFNQLAEKYNALVKSAKKSDSQ